MKPAHVHLVSAVAAELLQRVDAVEEGRPLRLLDIGCGYGQLILDLLKTWPRLGRNLPEIELFGYEVFDHRAGTHGYREAVLAALSKEQPAVDWSDRIRLAAADEAWPFPEDFFDAVFSNQVLEHVEDMTHFFREEERVVRAGGVGVHFYPSREIVVEPHCGVPFAHRIDRNGLRNWIRRWSRLGIGKFPSYRRKRGSSLAGFCEEFHDYLGRYVYFRSNAKVRMLARERGAAAGFGYSRGLFWRGLKDDWEPSVYAFGQSLSSRSLLSPFACCTLVRRF